MKLVLCVNENGNGLRAGEVIDALPDNHVFSPIELTNPNWKVVQVDITRAEADGLLAEPFTPPGEPRTWRRMRLDVAGLPDSLTRAELYARVIEQ